MTLGEVLARSAEFLARKGIDSPRLDAELILARALGMTRLELYTSFDRPLTEAELAAARPLVERRGKREPLAYVLGDWGFRRLTLGRTPAPSSRGPRRRSWSSARLLPSPTSRRRALSTSAPGPAPSRSRSPTSSPDARVTATDIRPTRSRSRARTPSSSGCPSSSVETSLLDGVEGPFDLVVSNPPYVGEAEVAELQPEVRDWEPRIAVVGDEQTERIAGAPATC